MEKKVAVYTAVTKETGVIQEPSFISEQCDYICFTDDSTLQSSIWQIRPFPDNGLDNVRKWKQVKVLPHILLPEYDYTIWVDGTIEMTNSLDQLIENHLLYGKYDLYAFQHAESASLYAEAVDFIEQEKDRKETIEMQMKHYKEQQFPNKGGLTETSVLFRKTHSPEMTQLMNQWWEEITTFSFLDQLSFDYIAWKNHFNFGCLLKNKDETNAYFQHRQQHLVS